MNETGLAGTLQFILDIELLTHADYFVGTTNSGLPHVVDVLRYAVYNKDHATFVDASSLHQDWYSKMRRFWAAHAEGSARKLLSGDAQNLESRMESTWKKETARTLMQEARD